MTRYLVQPRDRIFVKYYGFLSFARNMGRDTGKNICKNFSSKYSQQCKCSHSKQSATDRLKNAFERVIQKKQKQPVI